MINSSPVSSPKN